MISRNMIKLIHSLEFKKYRRKEGLFVAEGPKVVGELMQWYKPEVIIATSEWLGNNPQLHEMDGNRCRMIEVTDEELHKASLMIHPQQVIALFRMPDVQRIRQEDIKNRLTIALDGVQDPGNLGTIIRIADWFGIDTVICSNDTADVYNPKVIQATMGSIARVNVAYTDLITLLDGLDDGIPVYGTSLNGNNIYTQQLTDNGIIIMGNEGNGISHGVLQKITRRLLIPDFSNGETADSLNVAIATAVTCSEFRRRGFVQGHKN